MAEFVERVGLGAGVFSLQSLDLLQVQESLDSRVEHRAGRDRGLGLVRDIRRDEDVFFDVHMRMGEKGNVLLVRVDARTIFRNLHPLQGG